ncbi:MAG TPA: hypothetical protein EYP21_05490 [Syntrophaceae bacterium]|nr:hypothetical protein [Syntrophaceae bacterium]
MSLQLMDLLPVDEWIELSKEINKNFGLQAVTFDKDANALHKPPVWANVLCPLIKGDKEGGAFICAQSHIVMANKAKVERKPVVEDCNAGFVKVVVPVFVGDDFLGVTGGCGLVREDGEVDTFFVAKTLHKNEEEVRDLLSRVKTISPQKLEEFVSYIQLRVKEIVQDFERKKG